MTTTAPARVLHARQVVRELERADAALVLALANTADKLVADDADEARKTVARALRRARAALKTIDLLEARQSALELEGPEGAP